MAETEADCADSQLDTEILKVCLLTQNRMPSPLRVLNLLERPYICGCLSFIGSHPMCDGTYAAHTERGGGAGRPGEGTRPGIGIDRRVTRDSQQSIAAGVIGRRYYARMTLVCVCACARYPCVYGCACI